MLSKGRRGGGASGGESEELGGGGPGSPLLQGSIGVNVLEKSWAQVYYLIRVLSRANLIPFPSRMWGGIRGVLQKIPIGVARGDIIAF